MVDPPREICLVFLSKNMEDVVNTGAAKNLKKGTKGKKKTWTIGEEEILISKWAENDCLFKTSSSDYKRHDKKAAAREIIKRELQSQLGSTFSGKHSVLC